MSELRHYTPFDRLINSIDNGLRTLMQEHHTTRTYPAKGIKEHELSQAEQTLSGRLMRVNHTGEICAQALYEGQALTARDPNIKKTMQHCADEEVDHLAWCEHRLKELHTHTSHLNPFFYLSALLLGTVAGILGDKVSLGFLAETERQVVIHLESHLKKLPTQDEKSRAIVAQMAEDEAKHQSTAIQAGGHTFPKLIRKLMAASAKVMTSSTYWL